MPGKVGHMYDAMVAQGGTGIKSIHTENTTAAARGKGWKNVSRSFTVHRQC